nr:long-chain fatty acid--CoA ligase [Propionibacterium sp.]
MEDVDVAAVMAQAPSSVGALFNRRVERSRHDEAFRAPRGDGWASLTWAEAKEQVDTLAAGLLALGLEFEGRVAIASSTRLEWILLDLAINSAGGATTTIYPNTGPGDFAHIVSHSGSRFFVAENDTQLAKLTDNDALWTQVERVILIDGDAPDDRVITWQQLLDAGRSRLAEDPGCVQRATDATGPDTLATLIYTSGTTGLPKGVELTHGSWVYEGEVVNAMHLIDAGKLQYLWLPLSHVFGKLLIAAQLSIGFASAVDGRPDQIVNGLGTTHPHFMCGVPRVFERVRNAVMTAAPRSTLKGRISRWSFSVGAAARPYLIEGRPMPWQIGAPYRVADRLVFSKLRAKLGGNIEFLISGSAKLSSQVQQWFFSAGILIVEGYGMTETSAVACVNHPKTPRFGTVGPAIPGTTIRIAEDGEVLIKGPGIMRGYHKEPELTAEVLVDGWLHTGDIGFLDSDGYLTITDRKKDLMKTSGGKYVAPQKVENAIAANIPYVSQSVAVGDGRKYVSALLTLDPVNLERWAKNHKREGLTYAELTQLPEIRASIDRFMARANSRLEPWETVKRYAILDHEFSVDEGTTTPSMKVRRSIITQQYGDIVESLYDAEE